MPRKTNTRPRARYISIPISDALDAAMASLPKLEFGQKKWVYQTVFEEAMYALCEEFDQRGPIAAKAAGMNKFGVPVRFEFNPNQPGRAEAAEAAMHQVDAVLKKAAEVPGVS